LGKTSAQNDGLAMGAPTSSIFSEIYLESLDNQEILQLLNKHNIKVYFRYVDDILIVYDRNTSNIHDVTEDFNNIAPELKFTLEREMNRQINYLDITIQRTQRGPSTNIYRKPTTTDSIIPNDSCHPIGHKMAAIHYLYNRMNTYQLSQSAVKQEENTIIQILSNNKYDPSILDKVKHKKEKPKPKQNNKNHKWTKFTYIGRETLFITKILKKNQSQNYLLHEQHSRKTPIRKTGKNHKYI